MKVAVVALLLLVALAVHTSTAFFLPYGSYGAFGFGGYRPFGYGRLLYGRGFGFGGPGIFGGFGRFGIW